MTAGIIAATIVRTDRELVNELRIADATSAARAIRLDGTGLRGRRIRRLTRSGVLLVAGTDRHYLDEARWAAFQQARRRRVLGVLAVTLTILAIGLAVGFFRS